MSVGRSYRRFDHARLFARVPTGRPGMTLSELMLAARLEEELRSACQNCLQRWRKWGAIRMVNTKGSAGLWVRVWSLQQLKQWLAESPNRQRPERPAPALVETCEPQLNYAEACAQVHSLGSMCEALRRGR